MIQFISILLTGAFAYWYYRTAERLGSSPLHWAAAGVIAYQVPAWAWMLMVTKPYTLTIRSASTQTGIGGFLFSHSWVLAGALVAWAVHEFVLKKIATRPQ